MKKIEFFFDYLSPYSYLAWCRLRQELPWLAGYGEVILTPVVLSQVIHAHETKGPAEIKPKRDYLMKDCIRTSRVLNVPFTLPAQLPFNSLYALRLSQKSLQETAQIPFVDMCFRYAWERGLDLGDIDAFDKYCINNKLLSEEGVDRTVMKELRRELKGQVARVFRLGVFGLPSFLIYDDGMEE